MNKRPKRFDPRSKYVRYDKKSGLWITQRKRIYLYWFKFLRIAEQDPDYKVDWSKYNGWGGGNYILGTKFDEFWEEKWQSLFGVKVMGGTAKFSLTTDKPKTDAIRYALLVYENKHRGSNWQIAKWIAKRENAKRGAGLTSSSLFYAREDMEGEYGAEDKLIIQSRIGRYKSSAKKYLSNVCVGQFP